MRIRIDSRAFLIISSIAVLVCSSAGIAKTEYNNLRRAVFKIHVDSQEPQMRKPWKRFSVSRGSGSGFHIGGGRIMTNAHVVAHGKFIAVQRDGDANKVEAYVESIAHDCDLAILRVAEPNYFDATPTLEIGALPKLQSPVVTIGYATGGEQVSITEGVVSRIGFRQYVHTGSVSHLLVQVDSAINPGNSGGPVIQNGKLVGVAFQTNTSAENTGYAIPTPVIRRFLRDIEDGSYDGHPFDGITYLGRAMSNDAAKSFHGLPEGKDGVKVVAISENAPAHGRLLPGDVLTSVDEHSIGNDGKIIYQGERVDFSVVYDLKVHGDSIAFGVIRNGKSLELNFKVDPAKRRYDPSNIHSNFQPFYVYSGLIFISLNRSFLKTFGSKWYQKAPTLLRYLHYYSQFDPLFKSSEEVVVYVGKLPHAVNAFVTNGLYGVVKSVGPVSVTSLKTLKAAIDGHKADYLDINFFYNANPIVLDTEWAKRAHEEILESYRVSPTMSLDGGGDGAVTKGVIR